MQHLRLLPARGFHVISRIHLLQGALGFLMSPAWLAVVVLWSFVGTTESLPASYFSPQDPLLPLWPQGGQDKVAWIYLALVYGMLLFPKIVGAALFAQRRSTQRAYNSRRLYMGSICVELFLSVLYAPIMMVQHTRATIDALLGRKMVWAPQNRSGRGYGWGTTLRFHWLETVLGSALVWGILSGTVSVFILPIAVSLAVSTVLSKLSAMPISRIGPRALRMETPHTLIEPRIIKSARDARASMKETLTQPYGPANFPAE